MNSGKIIGVLVLVAAIVDLMRIFNSYQAHNIDVISIFTFIATAAAAHKLLVK